ncbi:PREDICTED: At5g01610 [Prunus dulcis]|uniref:PREDICTED: At5g01610 n=1 Tax=Prunus dulcis TaxID=3755 RepID=A0A5E4FBD7_PRUDU|nr:PREDICTED: At5g01610 [Prunus dulcis]
MSSLAAILALFVILSPFATSSTAAAGNDDSRSAYDIIQDFDFPMGLLPKGVTGYELDRSNGQFRAYLNGSCSFALEGSYQLKYKSTISGSISKNKLSGLTGVSVKVLFLWLNIVEVTRSGDNLEFSVGIASAAFPIDNFYECPQCGCGLDCVNGQVFDMDSLEMIELGADEQVVSNSTLLECVRVQIRFRVLGYRHRVCES